MEKKNEILDLSIRFSLDIIKYTELLEISRKFVIANQLMKSGTSIELIFLKHRVLKAGQTLSTS